MTKLELYREQLNRCCGPVPKKFVKPKLTGIQKELRLQEESRYEDCSALPATR